ncbi:MAG: hypothetical protein GF331_04420 [Chitinivibrionales bacterium]|nr:hypothetical protein [Chitinivibrionales bacterium]
MVQPDKINAIAVLVLVLLAVANGARADTLIDLSAPYTKGEAWFETGGNGQTDSIHFPGVATALLQSRTSIIPEDCTLYGYVSFDTTLPSSLGYRHDSSIALSEFWSWSAHGYIGNPDTVWEDATAFPDSLHVLDLLTVDVYARGKYCYLNNLPTLCSQPHLWSAYINPNLPAIIYMRGSNDRSVKMQIAECVVESSLVHADTGLHLSKEVTKVLIRWAADSAGNGVFKHENAAIHFPRSAPPVAGSACHQSGVQPLSSRPYFDLRGRPVARGGAGVYLTPEGCAVLLRMKRFER